MLTEVINSTTHNSRGQPRARHAIQRQTVKPLCIKEKTRCSDLVRYPASGAKSAYQASTTSFSTVIPTALVENFIFTGLACRLLAELAFVLLPVKDT